MDKSTSWTHPPANGDYQPARQWLPIETAPRDRVILVRGGRRGNEHFCKDDLSEPYDAELQYAPAVVVWRDDGFYPANGWIITHYDGGIMLVRYEEPTEWMDIPR